VGVFRYQYAFIHDLVTANETVGFRASEVAAFPIIADEETQFSFFLSFSLFFGFRCHSFTPPIWPRILTVFLACRHRYLRVLFRFPPASRCLLHFKADRRRRHFSRPPRLSLAGMTFSITAADRLTNRNAVPNSVVRVRRSSVRFSVAPPTQPFTKTKNARPTKRKLGSFYQPLPRPQSR